MNEFLHVAVWLAGVGHFCLLLASVQVPARLRWKEDLAKLAPLNRKLLWMYGGFTVLTIVAFGTLTLTLREELVRGDRAAVAIAAFIGIYWAARLAVELCYFRAEDWPPGRLLKLGRIALTSLFAFLASTYLLLVITCS